MFLKILIIIVSGMLVLSAADDKQPPKQAPFTPLQRALFDKTNAQADALALEYKIPEYRKKLDPIAAEQNGVIEEACKAIGIAEDKIKTDCGVDPTWIDPVSKKVVGRVFDTAPVKK